MSATVTIILPNRNEHTFEIEFSQVEADVVEKLHEAMLSERNDTLVGIARINKHLLRRL